MKLLRSIKFNNIKDYFAHSSGNVSVIAFGIMKLLKSNTKLLISLMLVSSVFIVACKDPKVFEVIQGEIVFEPRFEEIDLPNTTDTSLAITLNNGSITDKIFSEVRSFESNVSFEISSVKITDFELVPKSSEGLVISDRVIKFNLVIQNNPYHQTVISENHFLLSDSFTKQKTNQDTITMIGQSLNFVEQLKESTENDYFSLYTTANSSLYEYSISWNGYLSYKIEYKVEKITN